MKIELSFDIEIKPDGDWYIASCHELDVHSQGRTKRKARKNLKEAVELFLQVYFENIKKQVGV